VRSNTNFKPRMTFLAQQSTNECEPWSSEARPKFPGRW
jgi:hypothetical protein